jgi:glyoxylase-like metal-dependent hydrolase (beta-lactamase superfamily II)
MRVHPAIGIVALALLGSCAPPDQAPAPAAAPAAAPGQAPQQTQDFSTVQVVAHPLAGNVHYLEGRGGNIGVLAGTDGVVIVDDQFAPLTEKIVAAIGTLTDEDVRFVINTHVHPDHMGGNANFAARGAAIVAHDNVRVRMMQGIRGGPPEPVAAWPVVTYGDKLAMHVNGEVLEIMKVPPAHTDGDSFVYFKKANVLHLGDVFRTGAFPVIDTQNGGTAQGTIEALEMAIAMAEADTIVLPGHGTPSSRADVQEFLDMLVDVERRVAALVDQGMTLEQVLAAAPTAGYTDLGSPDRFLTGLYESLTAN